jgi:hypothetical protein
MVGQELRFREREVPGMDSQRLTRITGTINSRETPHHG